ncbi:MAG: hypothetical protein KAQ92_05845 [Candidatus Aenigmarchaeota archaeon]|nr:hypothetical protein [Candidatus Aenigmarchaeota archaeon]
MVDEQRFQSIGSSKFLLVPYPFMKVYNLDKYVYLCEIKNNGKQIVFTRMKKDDKEKKAIKNKNE